MAEGEFALVRQHLEIAFHKSAAWVGEHALYAMLVDAAAQQRDEAGLRQYAPLAEEAAARYDHKLYKAIAHRAWGVAHRLGGQPGESASRLQEALGLFEQLGTRWQIGRTLFELGELGISQNQGEAARDYFLRALSLFEAMQAAPDAARARAMLERLSG